MIELVKIINNNIKKLTLIYYNYPNPSGKLDFSVFCLCILFTTYKPLSNVYDWLIHTELSDIIYWVYKQLSFDVQTVLYEEDIEPIIKALYKSILIMKEFNQQNNNLQIQMNKSFDLKRLVQAINLSNHQKAKAYLSGERPSNFRMLQRTFVETTIETLTYLLRDERHIQKINHLDEKEFQLRNFVDLLKTNAIEVAILFDYLPVKCTRAAYYVKQGERVFSENGYSYDSSERKVHTFTNDDYRQFNILYAEPKEIKHKSNQKDPIYRMGEMQTYFSNVFQGAANTMTEMHRDFMGCNGFILNDNGFKLFLFAEYDEVERTLLFEKKQNENLKPLIHIEILSNMKSFRWCVLRKGQYIYWPATTYHAIYNIENSTFISPSYLPATLTTEWLPWLEKQNGLSKSSIQAVKEIVAQHLNTKIVQEYLSLEQLFILQLLVNKK